jgi:ribosome modulation factor
MRDEPERGIRFQRGMSLSQEMACWQGINLRSCWLIGKRPAEVPRPAQSWHDRSAFGIHDHATR